jgi:hypothetical protein
MHAFGSGALAEHRCALQLAVSRKGQKGCAEQRGCGRALESRGRKGVPNIEGAVARLNHPWDVRMDNLSFGHHRGGE